VIPSGIRLYSWIDVEDVLLDTQEKREWPDWLIWARAYWDGLTLGIRPGQAQEAMDWLASRFEPRFHEQPASIELEGLPSAPRLLPVLLEEEVPVSEPKRSTFVPTYARPSILTKFGHQVHPDPLPADFPPLVAFHSFKGGVGRTLHALALALALSRKGFRVLLVDADLEAPGLTWLFQERFPNPSISFVDLLALVHGDPDPTAEGSIELVANRVRDSHFDGIYGLASFRSPSQFNSLEIRPEHLTRNATDPFVLTSVLARVGRQLGAHVVIVDLRAGLSELSAGLLLDPRIHRVLVTTLSSQSLDGTCRMLEVLSATVPCRSDEEPVPALVLSQVPRDSQQHLLEAESKLIEAARPLLPDEGEAATQEMVRVTTDFESNLQVLPASWEAVLERIQQASVMRQIEPLVDWLPLESAVAGESESIEAPSEEALPSYREELSRFTEKLIYAETGEIREFLVTPPLKRLASDFSSRPPIAVLVGSKGAGKTYTFLQATYRETWDRFRTATGEASAGYEALLCPILKSLNLHDSARANVDERLTRAVDDIGLSMPGEESSIRDYIRDGLQEELHEGQWRDRWLNVIAWRLGFKIGMEEAGTELPGFLRESGRTVIVLMDGLEDLFQKFSSDSSQQTALRSLLQELPDWLEQQPLRPLGLLLFVRRDMLLGAVRQNPAQLIARYEPYALKWGEEEALRLVAWTAAQSKVLRLGGEESIERAGRHKLVDWLVPLWGRKLGRERSREAVSAAWVIAALSDLKGQIQARDLVRFLHEAAKASRGDTYWKDRVLVPQAIRNALEPCSRAKVEEIRLENPKLDEIFTKLESLPDGDRQIPFTRDQVNLTAEELKTLEDNGAVLREGEEYYMPEIFRPGLGFKLRRGARPRVMILANRARR
jgi:cellulose biosynthesis protein BcsQ